MKKQHFAWVGLLVSLFAVTAPAATPCWKSATAVCTDGPSTRVIGGIEVTRSCWNRKLEFTCGVNPSVDNCVTVRSTPGCNMVAQSCISQDLDGTCLNYEYQFDCVTHTSTTQQVCGGDTFCVDGACGPGTTAGPNGFQQSYSTLVAAREAASSFDEATSRVLPGIDKRCRKALNGNFDCCGSGGILNDVASCNQEEQDLSEANKPVHRTVYIGNYCSVKVGCPLCYCVEKKYTYCTFGSVMARIIQEQGRAQIGKIWGTPESPDCSGFLLSEFTSLDFAALDFSEFIATVAVPPPNTTGAITDATTNISNQQNPY